MNDYSIAVEDTPPAAATAHVIEGLRAYNRGWTGRPSTVAINVFARGGDGNVVGGLLGETGWGWLQIGYFWIEEAERKRGLGTRLLAAAETEALARGCTQAFLDTYSFQARPFYERAGYRVFSILEEFPPGYARLFMRKRLETAW